MNGKSVSGIADDSGIEVDSYREGEIHFYIWDGGSTISLFLTSEEAFKLAAYIKSELAEGNE